MKSEPLPSTLNPLRVLVNEPGEVGNIMIIEHLVVMIVHDESKRSMQIL